MVLSHVVSFTNIMFYFEAFNLNFQFLIVCCVQGKKTGKAQKEDSLEESVNLGAGVDDSDDDSDIEVLDEDLPDERLQDLFAMVTDSNKKVDAAASSSKDAGSATKFWPAGMFQVDDDSDLEIVTKRKKKKGGSESPGRPRGRPRAGSHSPSPWKSPTRRRAEKMEALDVGDDSEAFTGMPPPARRFSPRRDESSAAASASASSAAASRPAASASAISASASSAAEIRRNMSNLSAGSTDSKRMHPQDIDAKFLMPSGQHPLDQMKRMNPAAYAEMKGANLSAAGSHAEQKKRIRKLFNKETKGPRRVSGAMELPKKASVRHVELDLDDSVTKDYLARVDKFEEGLREDGEDANEMVSVDAGSGELMVPAWLWKSLYKYQQKGVQWLWHLHHFQHTWQGP